MGGATGGAGGASGPPTFRCKGARGGQISTKYIVVGLQIFVTTPQAWTYAWAYWAAARGPQPIGGPLKWLISSDISDIWILMKQVK